MFCKVLIAHIIILCTQYVDFDLYGDGIIFAFMLIG